MEPKRRKLAAAEHVAAARIAEASWHTCHAVNSVLLIRAADPCC